jgi:hypothetical protein
MVISELALCAAKRTGIACTPTKVSVVKNVSVPNFMMYPRCLSYTHVDVVVVAIVVLQLFKLRPRVL